MSGGNSTGASMKGLIDHCERCGDKLNLRNTVYLQLNSKTGKYSDGGVPDDADQGWFAFGRACADRVLKNDGVLVRLRRRRGFSVA
jgi:hypothetical protein